MPETFSHSMLQAYLECPQKYKLAFIDKISLPQDFSTAITGKKIHALINYYLNNFDISIFLDNLDEKTKQLWQNFLKLNVKPQDIYKSEYAFSVKISNEFWLTGRIDAIKIEKSKNNNSKDAKYIIFDWKSGKIPENNKFDLQSAIYLYSLYKILKLNNKITNYENISFTYFSLKDNLSNTIRLSEEKYFTYEEKILEIIRNITIKVFENNADVTKCYNCKSKNMCKTPVFFKKNML